MYGRTLDIYRQRWVWIFPLLVKITILSLVLYFLWSAFHFTPTDAAANGSDAVTTSPTGQTQSWFDALAGIGYLIMLVSAIILFFWHMVDDFLGLSRLQPLVRFGEDGIMARMRSRGRSFPYAEIDGIRLVGVRQPRFLLRTMRSEVEPEIANRFDPLFLFRKTRLCLEISGDKKQIFRHFLPTLSPKGLNFRTLTKGTYLVNINNLDGDPFAMIQQVQALLADRQKYSGRQNNPARAHAT